MRICFSLLFILSCFSAFSQSKKYRKNTHVWKNEFTSPAVDPIYKDHDAIILEDSTEFDFMENIVTRSIKFKILTKKGIVKYHHIKLPESFDPDRHYYETAFWKRKDAHFPLGDYDLVKEFAARVKRSDGKVEDALVLASSKKEEVLGRYFYGFTFRIEDLREGDEVEVYYKYQYPTIWYRRYSGYAGKSDEVFLNTERLFFNDVIPKQRLNWKVKFDPSNRLFCFLYFNGAIPLDSGSIGNRTTQLVWKLNNVPAGRNEPGAILAKDGMYTCFYRHYRDFGIKKDINDVVFEKLLGYQWDSYLLDMIDFKSKYGANDKLITKDKTTVEVNKFYSNVSASSEIKSAFGRMQKIHETIVDSFTYQNDIAYWSREDMKNERLGYFMEKKCLREISRHHLYYKMLHRTQVDYRLALIPDKRLEAIDFKEYFPLINSYSFYVLKDKGNSYFIYPKHNRTGYFTNELPFYLEDVPIFQVPKTLPYEAQFALKSNNYKVTFSSQEPPEDTSFYEINYLTTFSPFSAVKDNRRLSTVVVNVELDSALTRFDAKIDLLGQFSTMCRSSYLFDEVDSLANCKYGEKIYKLAAPVRHTGTTVVSKQKTFPFKSVLRCKYESEQLLSRNGQGLTLNIHNWFNHIIYEDFSSRNRSLPYYPDFKGQDIYRYIIRFSKPVSIKNAEKFHTKIENTLGRFNCNIIQNNEKEIVLETEFVISADKVSVGQCGDVEEIFTAIQKLNSSKLELSIK